MSSGVSFLNFHSGFSRKSPTMPQQLRVTKSGSIPPQVFQPNTEEMRRVFNKFDTNKDGKISKEEYAMALGVLGGKKTKFEVAEAFKAIDANGDGFIDFEEFMQAQKKEGGIHTRDIQSAFNVFDLDGDGKISAEELVQVLRRIGERCSLEACRKMVRGVDVNGDGMIDMNEFMSLMTRTLKLA